MEEEENQSEDQVAVLTGGIDLGLDIFWTVVRMEV